LWDGAKLRWKVRLSVAYADICSSELCTPAGHSEAVEGAFVDLKERFVGWDSSNIEDIWQSAYRHRFYRGGEVLMSAISG